MDDTVMQQVRQNQEARPLSAQMVPSYAPSQVFFLLRTVGVLRYNDHKMVYAFLKCTVS